MMSGTSENKNLKEYLKKWKPANGYGYIFYAAHDNTLAYLIDVQNIDPELAVDEINELKESQAILLQQLYQYGLRGKHLRSWEGSNKYETFKQCHQDILTYLIKVKEKDPAQAMREINGLEDGQVTALLQLYQYGLRSEHLRSWKPAEGCNWFTGGHQSALKYLICKRNIDPELAVQEISGLQDGQADSLHKLYEDGLRGKHLRIWKPAEKRQYFSQIYQNALTYFIKNERISPEDAIQKINSLTEIQVQQLISAQTQEFSKDQISKKGVSKIGMFSQLDASVNSSGNDITPLQESLLSGFVGFKPGQS